MGSVANTAAAISPKAKAALAAARLLKKKKDAASAAPKKGAAKKSAKKSKSTRESKVQPGHWAKIVSMWDGGKSSSEISEALGFTDKKSNWPYSYTLGLIKRLKAGVEVNGKKYKITARRK